MKRFNNSPEMLIVAVGLIFAGVIMLSTLFYTPKPATATVIHSNDSSATILDETISETVLEETAPVETAHVKPSTNLININTANADTLATLDGIGPSKAQKIIDYRSSNGNFTSINEIMNVSGIGEKTFEKIKNNITV